MLYQNPLDDATFDTGKKWKSLAGVVYRVLRKKFNTGALPNATTKNVAHGEAGIDPNKYVDVVSFHANKADASASLTKMTALISITVDGTNIKLTSGADQSTYTVSEVILEWAQA
jgi:hypothetical protein